MTLSQLTRAPRHCGKRCVRWRVPGRLGLPALRRSLLALLARVLDDRVRTREHQAGMAVVETHQVGRLPARPAHLDDLACPLRLAHDVATHMELVPDGCLHQSTSSPAFARSPCPGGHARVCHLIMASTYPGAGG